LFKPGAAKAEIGTPIPKQDTAMSFANRLAKESSPYLLQHAHNPVDWYPWGEEAMQKAEQEDMAILLSIGYSACHWCHVMERESFEDPEVAEIMNRNFVSIKIDREERPDLDHIYMDAVQAMTGSGGWPLNVFLTPSGKPFYGGTYFPPAPAFGRPSWKQVLSSIALSFKEKRNALEEQSESLVGHLVKSNDFGVGSPSHQDSELGSVCTEQNLRQAFDHIMQAADRQLGGFGRAPKFPQTFIVRFLLQYCYCWGDRDALDQACLSLDKMIKGGIYDQVGGGFARYSTDDQWLVPHFEKMLYDNALLVVALSEAYQLSGAMHYRHALAQTMDFISREMLSPEGGFYSALDADSEGIEGKYYTWQKSEIDQLLAEDSAMFCAYYGVRSEGNWEHQNILHVAVEAEVLARSLGMDAAQLEQRLARCRTKLLAYRTARIAPGLDDKVLLGWNALMITACCKAYAATGTLSYRQLAERSEQFIWTHLRGTGLTYFCHSYKNGKTRIPAFLDDYSYLIEALIQLQEVTGQSDYLLKARELTEFVLENFSESSSGQFFFTHQAQPDIIIRKKEIYDGAVPSGNAVMAMNLLYLSVIFDRPDWKQRAIHNCLALSDVILRYPISFGVWATVMQALTYGMVEVAITGVKLEAVREEFLRTFIPYRVFQSATHINNDFPLLENKPITAPPLIFLCSDYTCQNPVTEVHELIRLLETVRN
jgi:uncharacterized protein